MESALQLQAWEPDEYGPHESVFICTQPRGQCASVPFADFVWLDFINAIETYSLKFRR